MFLEINNGNITIKVRGYTYERKQCNLLSKEDTTSSTMFTEGIFLPCMVAIMEGQDVSTADIPGAFLQTN